MTKGSKISLIVFGVLILMLLLMGGCVAGKYNSFVKQDEVCTMAWANVETVLQRRYDLIPNLVNTVKGFATQERELLTEVTRLRSQWSAAKSAGNTGESVKTAGMLEGALGRLMVSVERYPDLKSNQNFLALQEELAGTENRISVERRRYNEAVARYNQVIRQYPGNIVANMLGFDRKSPFEAAPEAGAVPVVEF